MNGTGISDLYGIYRHQPKYIDDAQLSEKSIYSTKGCREGVGFFGNYPLLIPYLAANCTKFRQCIEHWIAITTLLLLILASCLFFTAHTNTVKLSHSEFRTEYVTPGLNYLTLISRLWSSTIGYECLNEVSYIQLQYLGQTLS
jgi:hypothetical protein